MHFDQDGTYNLVYTAEDECGNTTLAERVVEVFSLRTVLYPDGTFIINEKSTDQASNEALHGGAATNVYVPWDSVAIKYDFGNYASRPWNSEVANVTAVEFGSEVAPRELSYWFYGMENLVSVNWDNCNTQNVTGAYQLFANCSSLVSVDWSALNLTSLHSIDYMCSRCYALSSIDFGANLITLNSMRNAFEYCVALKTLDVSMFDTSAVRDMSYVFRNCTQLITIFASDLFDTSSVTSSMWMFNNADRIVGGAGTVYNGSYRDKTYAHIDGGTSNPGYFTAKA